ncbi:MAG TPA: hypothetical protein VIJ12_07930 [Candidatus Baltobacteraceae bacterium]
MKFRGLGMAIGLVAVLLVARSLRAEEPAHYTFSPAPPGTMTQSAMGYLAGQAMHSQWRAVTSKRVVGKRGKLSFFQSYLSIYAIDNTTYRLKYRSPGNGGPLDTVTKAHGAAMWFPMQTINIVGFGQFIQPTVEQLVVASHEQAADCGGAQVTVFAYNPHTNKVASSATVRNGCQLVARIVRGSGNVPDSIVLVGPYYGPKAAMCCPTKNSATATLRFAAGGWVESPQYFPLTQ